MFLIPFLRTRKEIPRFGPRVLPPLILPVLVFSLTTFGANYAFLSSEYFFDQFLERTLGQAANDAERERAERVHETTMLALKNPAIRIILSADFCFVALRTLLAVVVLVWLVLGVLSGRWEASREYWTAASVSSGILSLGVIIHLLLKFLLIEPEAGVGAALLIEHPDSANPVHLVLTRTNAFVIWFFWTSSRRTVGFHGENPRLAFLVFCLVWIAVLLAAFLLGIPILLVF